MVCLVTTEEPAESTPEAGQLTEWYTNILLEAGQRLQLPEVSGDRATLLIMIITHPASARPRNHLFTMTASSTTTS